MGSALTVGLGVSIVIIIFDVLIFDSLDDGTVGRWEVVVVAGMEVGAFVLVVVVIVIMLDIIIFIFRSSLRVVDVVGTPLLEEGDDGATPARFMSTSTNKSGKL